jgi:ATP-binding cassette subfamily B (MDR/TAP) protein 1
MINGQNKRGLQANINAGGIFSEFVVNSKTVFTFNFQKTAINTYLETIEYLKNNFVRDSIINGFFIGFGNFCSYAAYSSVFGAAKKFIIEDNLDSEYMSLATSIVTSCGQGLTTGFGNLGELKKSKLAFKSIYSILGTKSLISQFNEDNFGKKSANNLEGKIEFRHVFFSYPTNPESVVIKDLSMTILPGQHVALVGHSGSGKSTIIQLLSRFYDIEEGKGEILIDDINIKDYNLYELRKKIGLVSQEPSLFKTTVLENVRYGRLEATDQECIEAAKKANIMKLFTKERINEIIETSKPDKYSFHGPHGPHCPHGPHGPHGPNNPPFGPHGSHGPNKSIKPHGPNGENSQKLGSKKEPVSGGEKQRLAIARAFLKNPTILLLDEATSSLDKISEIEIQKSLEALVKNRTCISVAHRLSTIEKCDKIFVLENGSIIEQGNHNELMNLGKKYYTLHKYTNMK